MLLQNLKALITGASSGIGRAIAYRLARNGATVCLVGRRRRALEELTECLHAEQASAFYLMADLAVDEDIQSLADQISREWTELNILVHSAAVYKAGAIDRAPVEDFDLQYRANLRAPYMLTQHLLPMLRRGRGQIVFLNSSVAVNSKSCVSQYAATKQGLKAVADSVRNELNDEGVRVLTVFAGRTATPMQEGIYRSDLKEYHPEYLLQPEDIAEMVVAAISLPRTAEVTEISIRPFRRP
jgi:NADP-dependent 3-hydroxy acid dehydrogenase YdfG